MTKAELMRKIEQLEQLIGASERVVCTQVQHDEIARAQADGAECFVVETGIDRPLLEMID
jgi:hypothetical protein